MLSLLAAVAAAFAQVSATAAAAGAAAAGLESPMLARCPQCHPPRSQGRVKGQGQGLSSGGKEGGRVSEEGREKVGGEFGRCFLNKQET